MRPAWTLFALLLPGLVAAPAAARDTVGVFKSWGAFRDLSPRHCFAVAEPVQRPAGGGERPFAAVATWPAQGVRAQLHIHLSRRKLRGAPVFLAIGERRFALDRKSVV